MFFHHLIVLLEGGSLIPTGVTPHLLFDDLGAVRTAAAPPTGSSLRGEGPHLGAFARGGSGTTMPSGHHAAPASGVGTL